MRPQPSRQEPISPPLETLAEEVAQLRDLFQRRLFEDKAKNRLYEELHEQLALARGALSEQLLTPILKDLLLVVDRVTILNKDGDVVLDSITDELLELLERRDVRPVPSREMFDVALHEAVGTAEDGNSPPGAILKIARRGYLIGDRLLRAEQVIVASSAEPTPDPDGDRPEPDGPVEVVGEPAGTDA